MNQSNSILDTPIEYLKGIGPQRGKLLREELNVHTFGDLLRHFPYRHIDKTRVFPISAINSQTDMVQVKGKLGAPEETAIKGRRRLTVLLTDETGVVELTWFQGIQWVKKSLTPGRMYIVYGKVNWFRNVPQISHPEIEPADEENSSGKNYLEPVYPTTEKLKNLFITGRAIGKFTAALLPQIGAGDLPEFLPEEMLLRAKLMNRYEAMRQIHFPPGQSAYSAALRRLKFEELFLQQIKLNQVRIRRHQQSRGLLFSKVGEWFNAFYAHYLPFELTGAQKKVLREIRTDCGSGRQMNRLLQGDVGSGKTMVALMSMLLAADNGYQSCLMAPTEILARQHFEGISALLKDLPVKVDLLTGSTKSAHRKLLLQASADGSLHILIGTHALIESAVQFKNLGLAIIDEQHRFGVEQRSKLWKRDDIPPHVLVMTATPIPRTLSMSMFGDLDVSIIDELPPGRKPVTTVHRYESSRHNVLEFAAEEIAKGRQVYIIFPLIEESSKLEFENLMRGYENVKAFFPEPRYWISMVHGRMGPEEKKTNMDRFISGDTQIMVSTTVIEVGVNVPNASLMIIESAEKFGLSQLHQLRGRVGRGAEQSFCILLTGPGLTSDARERLKIMCSTNDGFKIAEKDMELRGPGDMEGTRQSGMLNFKLASIVQDKALMEEARRWAEYVLAADVELTQPQNAALRQFLMTRGRKTAWSSIS